MDIIARKVNEVKSILWKITSFATILDMLIIFLISAILLSLLGVSYIYAGIPLIPFFIIQVIRSRYKDRDALDSVGCRYPSLDEKLKTAYESEDSYEDNIIVKGLVCDVSKEIEEVESVAFFNTKRVALRVLFSTILIFILLAISTIELPTFEIDFNIKGVEELEHTLNVPGRGDVPGKGVGTGTGLGVGTESMGDIYGGISVASIEGSELEMEIHPEYGDEINIGGESKSKKETPFSSITYGIEHRAMQAEAFKENIPLEDEALVRAYFEKLTEES